MYEFRRMSPAEREAIVTERQRQGFPWHSPPHLAAAGFRIVTGTCYEHRPWLDSPQRLAWFERELLQALSGLSLVCAAWCVLPNHYHVLIQVLDIKTFTRGLGRLHGRTSYEMNQEDHQQGRKVWYRTQDRVMRSERHYYTSLNYIHNNPVKHGYVKRWQEWPFSSAEWYLDHKGREWLLDLWREYPVLNYGAEWD